MDLTNITDPVKSMAAKKIMSQSSQGWDTSFIYLPYLRRMTAGQITFSCIVFLVIDFQLWTNGASEPIYRVGIETQT